MKLMAESGASVVHNPLSNLRLGSGVAPLSECARTPNPVLQSHTNLFFVSDNNAWDNPASGTRPLELT